MIKVTQARTAPYFEGSMGPKPFRKAAYVALIVLLFGVSSGWLGGI